MQEPTKPMLLQCDHLLAVLLHHPSMNTLQVVSRMLATSKALAAAISSHCFAAVPTRLQGASPAEYNPFVARHGRLFCSLHTAFRDSASLAGVAAAMAKAAAAAPDGVLQLRSVAGCCLTGTMLASVSPRHLTSLAFDRFPPGDPGSGAALERLTALQQLRISDAAPQLLPALAALTQLTQLTLGGLDGPAFVQLQPQLPASLRSLTLQARPQAAAASAADGGSGGQRTPRAFWQLGHLTALTHLSPVAELQPSDDLPPNLPTCQVVRCRCVRSLLPLQRLVQLRIRSCEVPAQELRLLAGLPLAAVQLEFASRHSWQAAAGALAQLPVRELRLSGSCAAMLQDRPQPGPGSSQPGDNSSSSSSSSSDVCVQQLATLQGLQDLWISNKVVAATQRLTGLLRQLTCLCSLSLINICSREEDCRQQAAIADGMLGLFCAAAALPALQSLRLSFMRCCSPETVAELARAVRLTELCLHDCDGVDDSSMEALLTRLTALQVLDVSRVYASRGSGVTDVVLPVMAAALPRLRELRLNYCTRVTDAGVACLGSLQLTVLNVDHTPVTPAARRRALRKEPFGVQHSGG